MSHPRKADDVFAEFFGVSSPSGPRNADGVYSEYFGVSRPFVQRNEDNTFTEVFGVSSPSGGGDGGFLHHDGARKAAPIETKLPCSLDHLYSGTTKKMKISREIIDFTG